MLDSVSVRFNVLEIRKYGRRRRDFINTRCDSGRPIRSSFIFIILYNNTRYDGRAASAPAIDGAYRVERCQKIYICRRSRYVDNEYYRLSNLDFFKS